MLPGIRSVRMDVNPIVSKDEEILDEQEESWSNSSFLILPPKRSLHSWMRLSNQNVKAVSQENIDDDNQMDNNINLKGDFSQWNKQRTNWAASCINNI